MTKNEAREEIEKLNIKIKELQKIQEKEDLEFIEFVKIDYSVIPQSLFEKYGVKPFEIMRKKMRKDKGEVWNNINYFDAQKECEKLGYRLPNLREMLMLLEFYKTSKKEIAKEDKEFLGIEELSYNEDVYLEWVYFMDDVAFKRGGYWSSGAAAGAFTLSLYGAPSSAYTGVGFRLCKNI